MLVCLTWIVRSYSVGGRRQVKAFFIFIFIFAMPYTSALALPSLPPSVPFKHESRRSQKSFKRQTLGIRLFCHVAHVSWQFQSTVVGMASHLPCTPIPTTPETGCIYFGSITTKWSEDVEQSGNSNCVEGDRVETRVLWNRGKLVRRS